MTVYIDDMHKTGMGEFRGMKMSHMIAETEAELHAFADSIGLKRSWFQGDHYDVAKGKRALAIRNGAIAIPLKTLASMAGNARAQWPMGTPPTARAISELRRSCRDDASTLLNATLPRPEAGDALSAVHWVSLHLLCRVAGRIPAASVAFTPETGSITLDWAAHGVRLHVEILPEASDKVTVHAAVHDSWGVLDDWRGQDDQLQETSRAQTTIAARHRAEFLRMVEDHVTRGTEPRQPAFL